MGLMIASMVMLAIAMAVPWYQVDTETEGFGTYHADLGLEGREWETDLEQGDDDDGKEDWGDSELSEWDETEEVFDTLNSIMMGAVVMAIVSMVFIALVGIVRLVPVNLALLIVAISFLLAMAAPLYFLAALPAAIEDDEVLEGDEVKYSGFIGEDSTDDLKMSWGPHAGWVLALVAMILQLAALGIMAKDRYAYPPPRRMGGGYGAPPPPGYQQQQSGPPPQQPPPQW
jgi:amino acid transporter